MEPTSGFIQPMKQGNAHTSRLHRSVGTQTTRLTGLLSSAHWRRSCTPRRFSSSAARGRRNKVTELPHSRAQKPIPGRRAVQTWHFHWPSSHDALAISAGDIDPANGNTGTARIPGLVTCSGHSGVSQKLPLREAGRFESMAAGGKRAKPAAVHPSSDADRTTPCAGNRRDASTSRTFIFVCVHSNIQCLDEVSREEGFSNESSSYTGSLITEAKFICCQKSAEETH